MKNMFIPLALMVFFVPALIEANVLVTVEFVCNGVCFAKPVIQVVAGEIAAFCMQNNDENRIEINASLADNQVHVDVCVVHGSASERVDCNAAVDVAVGDSVVVVCPNSDASIVIVVQADQEVEVA